jgi:PPP family 3-phenylpropionic acid transporter
MAYEMARGAGRTFAIRAAAYSASFFFANGVFMPFFPIWLASKSLGPSQISVILALPLVVRTLLSPFLVGLADRLPSLRAAGTLYAFLTASLFVVPIFVSGFWTILLFTGAGLMFWSAIGPFTEAAILYGVREHGIDYPRVRLWGSLGFMSANLVAAVVVQRFTGDSVLLVLLCAYLAAGVIAMLSPRVPAPPAAAEKFGLKKAGHSLPGR